MRGRGAFGVVRGRGAFGVLSVLALLVGCEAGGPEGYRFAPAAPDGLVAVQEGEAVRLFWNPNAERDLGGYRVYRKTGDGAWTTLDPDPVGQAQYLDRALSPGDAVSYRVTAIDRADPPNESEPSEPAGLTVAEDPDGWKDGGP